MVQLFFFKNNLFEYFQRKTTSRIIPPCALHLYDKKNLNYFIISSKLRTNTGQIFKVSFCKNFGMKNVLLH